MSSYARVSFLGRDPHPLGDASIGGMPFRLNPTSVQLSYTVNTASTPTVGGLVVQVFGTEYSDLVVTGTFGVGGWPENVAFLNRMMALAASEVSGPNGTAPNPVRFYYPNRGYDFQVFLKEYTSPQGMAVDFENSNIAPEWTLTLFIENDNSGLVQAATDAYIQRLATGLGWTLSSFNGPVSVAEVQTFLAAQGFAGNPQGYIDAAFGDPTTAAATAAQNPSSSEAQPTGGGTSGSTDPASSILGTSAATATQMHNYYVNHRRAGNGRLQGVTFDQIIGWYISEGDHQNVRGDVAFVQACIETGNFTNNDTAINNYAGIGHFNDAPSGIAIAGPQVGVRAHIQLLYKVVNGNKAATVETDVSPNWGGKQSSTWVGLNGVWAVPGTTYAQSIMSEYAVMLKS